MDAFRFSPELFELRSDVLAVLHDAGYEWLSHFSAVDVLHDLYGIEVCGIVDEEDAHRIQAVLEGLFPAWLFGHVCYQDFGCDRGYKATVYRDEQPDIDQWETA